MADTQRFYLQWNIVNWITVVLMATVGMFLVGMLASAVRHYGGNASTQQMTET